ncbi:amino acid ABC transporter permease [Micromonospora sp. NPDC050200]|uniref:amino acid ABC transporter permease n=1 Tax=Micromonospora sp. NPDC050200 TaxID=3155664 RepID=UPI0033D6D84C
MGYDWQWSAITDNWHLLVSGLWLTIFYTATSAVLGLLMGSFLAMGRLSARLWLRIPATMVLEVLRGVPLLVLLVWIYYALPLFSGLSISAPVASVMALSLYGAAYYGEIVRGGILSIDPGQTDAGLSLGMTYGERMRRVVLPQAFRRMVPPLVNQSIIQLKNTSLVSVLTVAELTYQAQQISSSTYRSLEIYTTVAFLYLAMVIPSSMLARRLEVKNRRFGAAKRRTLKPEKQKAGVFA